MLSAQLRETTDLPTDQSDLLPTKIHTGGFSTLHGVLIRSAVPVPDHGHLRFDDDDYECTVRGVQLCTTAADVQVEIFCPKKKTSSFPSPKTAVDVVAAALVLLHVLISAQTLKQLLTTETEFSSTPSPQPWKHLSPAQSLARYSRNFSTFLYDIHLSVLDSACLACRSNNNSSSEISFSSQSTLSHWLWQAQTVPIQHTCIQSVSLCYVVAHIYYCTPEYGSENMTWTSRELIFLHPHTQINNIELVVAKAHEAYAHSLSSTRTLRTRLLASLKHLLRKMRPIYEIRTHCWRSP